MSQPYFCYLCRFPLMLGLFPLMLGHFHPIQRHSMKCLKFDTYRFQTNIYMKLFVVTCHASMINFRAINLLATFFHCHVYMFAGPFVLHLLVSEVTVKKHWKSLQYLCCHCPNGPKWWRNYWFFKDSRF